MARAEEGSFCFSGFSLDLSRCALERGGQRIPLRPKAFDTLRHLVEHPRRLVTKEELLEALWPGVWVTEDSVVQCIRAVRIALGDEDQRLLQTVPRRGYVFAADVTPVVREDAGAASATASGQPRPAPTVAIRPMPEHAPAVPPRRWFLWLGAAAVPLGLAALSKIVHWQPGARPAAPTFAEAPPRPFRLEAAGTAAPAAERRVALAVGAGGQGSADLLNARRDAAAVAEALRRIGFADVVLLQEPSRQVLLAALEEFAAAAEDADWAVIYYAGRGIEAGGAQFLLSAEIGPAGALAAGTVALASLLRSAAPARKLRLVIFDACRVAPEDADPRLLLANPSAHVALAIGSARRGATLTAFSTAQGQRAEDGHGNLGPYAEALLAEIATPGREIGAVFRAVRDRVLEATGGRQEAFLYGSLPAEPLYFRPP